MAEIEQGNIEPLKYQLRQWRKLVKYLPKTDCDRDDVAEIDKILKKWFARNQDPNIVDHSNDRQCPLCRQKVVLKDYYTGIQDHDNRFHQPCDKCRFSRRVADDEYPCRWCLNR